MTSREFGLAGAVMGQRQQPDHGAACPLLAVACQQRFEGALIGAAREQLLAIDQVEQRHRLAAQGVNDVAVIDDVAALAAGMRAAAAQRHQRCRTEEAFEPIVIETHAQTVADQPRRHRIEHLLEAEAAGRGDGDDRLLVIGRPARRQRFQGRALEIEPLGVARVAPPDDLVDEAAIGGERVEVARAAQQQRIFDRLLEMAVRAFDRAVLVRDAAIVARRLHAVMAAQRLVAARLILPRIVVEIAEGGRQAVAAMLQRRAAERPQRVLQPFGQRHEALAAEHDMGVFPAREGQPEVIEPMIERCAGDADAATAHVGEIGQPEPARRVLLPEDDVLLGAVSARQARMRRSRVRRMPAPISGCRRRSSSKIAIGRRPGVLFSSGTTSLSQTAASGSRRRRSRGVHPTVCRNASGRSILITSSL